MTDPLDYASKHGKRNGLSVLLNIEQFNYGYNTGKGAGLRVALMNTADKAMMQFSSLYIQPGSEYEINIKPVITYTTEDAIDRFDPEDRNCYKQGENELLALPAERGFRYTMDNCLVNEGLFKIFYNCRCFNRLAVTSPWYFCDEEGYGPCQGEGISCANKISENMGSEQQVSTDEENYEPICNITRPILKKCLPSCKFQDNPFTFTAIQYPPDENYLLQISFCQVASQILQRSCRDEHRLFFLDKRYPKLCPILEDFASLFDNETNCDNWPDDYFALHDQINTTLQDAVRDYGKSNLALLEVFHQSPYVTKIKRSVEMTFTAYVSNTGGLLGLYLGFSFVSCMELIYWIMKCFARIYSTSRSMDEVRPF